MKATEAFLRFASRDIHRRAIHGYPPQEMMLHSIRELSDCQDDPPYTATGDCEELLDTVFDLWPVLATARAVLSGKLDSAADDEDLDRCAAYGAWLEKEGVIADEQFAGACQIIFEEGYLRPLGVI